MGGWDTLSGFGVQIEVEFTLSRRHTLPRGGLQQLQLHIVVRRPDALDIPRTTPRGITIWTAVAPEAVFTVRTYGATTDSLETLA